MRRRALRLLVVVATSACSRGDGAGADSSSARAPGESAREVAVAVDRAVPTLERKEWTSTMGDASASLTAFRDGGALRLIRERISQGELGTRSSRYYFAGGKLRYYESEGELLVADSTGKPTVRRKEKVVMAFDILGALVDGARQLGDERSTLDETIVQGVMLRAQELQRQESATVPPPAKP